MEPTTVRARELVARIRALGDDEEEAVDILDHALRNERALATAHPERTLSCGCRMGYCVHTDPAT